MSDASVSQREHIVCWSHPDSAIRFVAPHLRLWGIAVAGLAIDLWTKAWAFRELRIDEVRKVIPGLLSLRLSLNTGALFGIGQGMVPVFIVASVAALAFVVYLFACSARAQRAVHVALALILAGALGNLYDRVFVQYDVVPVAARNGGEPTQLLGEVTAGANDQTLVFRPWWDPKETRRIARSEVVGQIRRMGVVRDFLKFTPEIDGRPIWPWVFNLADAFLVVGVCLLLLTYWRDRPRGRRRDRHGPAEVATE